MADKTLPSITVTDSQYQRLARITYQRLADNL